MSAASVAWVDWALLALVAVSMLVGVVRGLAYEVMSLMGWVVAYVAAPALSPLVSPALPVGRTGSGLNAAAAFVAVFVATLLVWSLLSWLIRQLVKASPLNPLDRALGALFGVLRGILAALVLATAVQMTPLYETPAWQASRAAEGLDLLLAGLKPLLPEPVSRRLRAVVVPTRSGA